MSEDGDALGRVYARSVDPDEQDGFDLDAELAALERDGFAFALPVVERVLDLHRLVRAVGFEGALRIGVGDWRGWETHFLGCALAAIDEAERRVEVLDSFSAFRSFFGARASG